MRGKILVVGSSNVDFVVGVQDMPKTGETIMSRSFDNVPGGKGANQACACGKLGGDCTFLSCVGTDGQAQLLLNSLKNANVDISAMKQLEGVPTGMAFIMVEQAGDNSIVVVPGANGHCDSAYFQENLQRIQEADVLLAQLETPVADVYALVQLAKSQGKTTVLNPAPAPDSIPQEVLVCVDWLTPNETELSKLTGLPTDTLDEISTAADVLLNQGVGNVLVTIGSRGVFLCTRERKQCFPTKKVTAVDTTAAGDTFNAGFVVGLAEGKTVEQAIALANAAASISVTRKGAQTSIPAREEVDAVVR